MTILHNLQQGSPEWHALRNRIRHTASDLAAIRGNSKYKTRAEAIREAATGIKPEINEFQQKKFYEGHVAEKKARAIVEEMIGDDLYPSTATTDDEFLLASSDGATMLSDTGYEHKLWNEELAGQIRDSRLTGECRIHPMYTDQMDQQIAVYGFDRIIFVTSNGTREKFEHIEYAGNPESISRIRDDWEQFDADVAAYQPEVVEAKTILHANPIDNLPALVIEVTGRVTHSNLVEFKAAANAVISSIKTELVTDQDFVDAAAAVKYLKDVEDNAKRAKQNALDQTASIAELHRALDEVSKMAGDVRKALDKKITEEKDRRKAEITHAARVELIDHVQRLHARIGVSCINIDSGIFGEAIKGLKSLDSMRDKVSATLANAKVEASAVGDRIDANLKSLEANGENWRFLFPDLASVCTKASDDFAALLAARVASHKSAEDKRLAAEREKIRAEEKEHAQRDAEIKQKQIVPPLSMHDVLHAAAPAAVAMAISPPEPDGHPGPTLNLGQINAALGFTVTSDFLAELGVRPVRHEKAAKLYEANKLATICRLIQEHLATVMQKALVGWQRKDQRGECASHTVHARVV